MRIIIYILITILFLSSPVYSVGRDMVLEAEGKIEYNTTVSNESSKVGLDVRGEGSLSLDNVGTYTETSIDQNYGLQIEAADDALIPIRAVTAAIVNSQTYALMVAPSAGETGVLDVEYKLGVGDMFESEFRAEALVEKGEFRSYVSLQDVADGVTLEEHLRVRGSAWFTDLITISIPEEDE